MMDKYDPASFFRKFAMGKTSTHDCRLLVTNYTLEAHALSPAVQGEAEADGNIRMARVTACTNAITAVQDLWRGRYEEAFRVAKIATEELSISAAQRRLLNREMALYRNLSQNPPQPQVSTQNLNSAAQARAAKHVTLNNLPHQQRTAHWVALLDKDVLASFFGHSREVVDHSTMWALPPQPADGQEGQKAGNPVQILPSCSPHRHRWTNLRGCIFHRLVLNNENFLEVLHTFSDQVLIRASFGQEEPTRQTIAYQRGPDLPDRQICMVHLIEPSPVLIVLRALCVCVTQLIKWSLSKP
ncbi:hypothetical protein BKA63DRAFT_569682 [Paraphoma chrysanthemicola]|nr:hypothetical protein BKA63DRAFT_569682 [Paraphoma chrysanthemicola]